MKLLIAYDEFILFKKSYCASKSVNYYKDNILQFLSWLSDTLNIPLFDLSVDVLSIKLYRQYLIYLRGKNIKNTSVNTYIRAVKVFVKWLYEEEYINEDITLRAKYPRQDADFIYPLTNEEVKKLDSVFNTNSYINTRNYCIVHLMLDCGLRTGEVVELKWQHVNNNFIEIFNSKCNKTRHVPLPEWLYDKLLLLRNYTSYVFLDDKKTSYITENTIKQLFQDLKVKSGIKRIHAHLLRHTFASSFIYYGGGLELLRILLGHADYATTQNYLHIASQMLVCGYDMYKIDNMFFSLSKKFGGNMFV